MVLCRIGSLAAVLPLLGSSCGTTLVVTRYVLKQCPSDSFEMSKTKISSFGTLLENSNPSWFPKTCSAFSTFKLDSERVTGIGNVAIGIAKRQSKCELVLITERVGRFGSASETFAAHRSFEVMATRIMEERIGPVVDAGKGAILIDSFRFDPDLLSEWCSKFPDSLDKLEWQQ